MLYQIKKHVRKHKTAYTIAGTAVTVAGITYLIMRDLNAPDCFPDRASELLPGSDEYSANATFKSFNFFSRNSGNIVNTIHNGERGHPGFMTKHIETGVTYPSQKAAAEAFGIPQSVVSSHLNGTLDDAYGQHFERI